MSADFSATLADDAGWFLHQIDPAQQRALIVRITQDELAKAAFLDERLLQTKRDGAWLPLDALPHFRVDDSPRHYIFHIGHCGSTLLSRLLDHWPDTLGLREPLPLRTLALLQEQSLFPSPSLTPPRLRDLRTDVLGLLGRRFSPSQRIVIKATSSCNALVSPLLQTLPDARMLLLWIPLETYLATILKSAHARRDALAFAPARLAWLHWYLGSDQLKFQASSEAETIALGWLAELARFSELARSSRVLMLNFDDFLSEPARHLQQVAGFFQLPDDTASIERALSSPASQRYAKATEHAYGASDRKHDLDLSRSRFAAQIVQGLHIANALADRHPALSELSDRFG